MSWPEEITCYGKPARPVLEKAGETLAKLDSKQRLAVLEAESPPAEMFALVTEILASSLISSGLLSEGEDGTTAGLFADRARPSFYRRWLSSSVTYLQEQKLLTDNMILSRSVKKLEELWNEWENGKQIWTRSGSVNAHIALLEACLKSLPGIINGTIPATDIIFPESSMKLVEGIYSGNSSADYYNERLADTLRECVRERLIDNADEQIRILEIGAGTGGTTVKLLPVVQEYEQSVTEYCYTDLSKAFLMHAEERYRPRCPVLTTAIFNVTRPIATQSINAGHYDFVIAANVLHATPDIRETLRNAKAVLRNGGILLLNETSTWSLFTHLTFGLLEGWWLHQDDALRITGSAGLSPEKWWKILHEEGFKSIMFPATEAHKFGQQIIAASSDGLVRQKVQPIKQPSSFTVGFGSGKKAADAVNVEHVVPGRTIAGELTSAGFDFDREEPVRFEEENVSPEPVSFGFLTDNAVKSHVRETLKACIAASLKMKTGKIEADRSFSDYGVDSIIAVQLVNQINGKLNILLQTTVLFDFNTLDKLADFIVSEHGESVRTLLRGRQTEKSSAIRSAVAGGEVRGGYDVIGRIMENRPAVKSPSVPVRHNDAATCHKLVIKGPGQIDEIEIQEAPLGELQSGQVCVSIKAFGLNFGDLLCVRGLYPTMPPYPFTPGYDASGVVVATGSSVRKVKVGDAVIVAGGESMGAHATVMMCDQDQLILKPDNMPFTDACALPVVSITMIDAFHKAELAKGESILIQTATSGTGLIAVQLAKHHGATIYATAGSAEKLEYLRSLGVRHCINYVENDFEAEILRLTEGRGVDVIINTLSGDAIQKGINCLAPGGRYIEIAMTALKSAKSVDLSGLASNQSFFSIDIRKLGFKDPKKLERYRDEMLSLYRHGIIRPVIGKVFSFESVREAYRALSDRRNIGKIVVTIPEALQLNPTLLASSTKAASSTARYTDSIAVIGMSGRFAESESLEEFWHNLREGKDLVRQVSRWRPEECVTTTSGKHGYCSCGSFVESLDRFDPLFFRISPIEAQYMDPQQRLFLEESWKALEDAGYAGRSMDEKLCGVYVGNKGSDYTRLFQDEPPEQSYWGNAPSVLPARIAYYLNLHGPAVSVDTACSSALVAIHMACQGLWSGETEMALAGGVFLQSTPEFYQLSNRASMLSPSGKCHTFDAGADGFVPGEGVGVVVLKRLGDAVRDRDSISGLIVGSGINQDGNTNGITAPSARSQERLECYVYDRFNIDPATIQVVEAHGTGTRLGDPIEYGAISRAFRRYTNKKQFCAMGSVKSNIGHAATAAGIAGLLKLLLAMKYRQIPPSLHFQKGNPAIDFDSSPFYVNTRLEEWKTEGDQRRRAAVSSFSFSGTNAHIVVEEPPLAEQGADTAPAYLLVLSAFSAEQLKRQVQRLLAFVRSNPGVSMNDMSYTLFVGRMYLTHRFSCIARNQEELVLFLERWLESEQVDQIYVSQIEEVEIREQSSLKEYANRCIQECGNGDNPVRYLENLATVADFYIRGYSLDYPSLLPAHSRRISLPTYPFAAERYWIDAVESRKESHNEAGVTTLHPLLHVNTSDLNRQSYLTVFDGREFFLSDHRLRNGHDTAQKLMPAVVYLEMARAAVAHAIPDRKDGTVLELHNIVWAQPVVVTGDRNVSVALYSDEADQIDFEISSHDGEVETTHCRGRAVFTKKPSVARIDISQLKEQPGTVRFAPDTIYNVFTGLGIEYGPAHRGIMALYRSNTQSVAELRLPVTVECSSGNYVLHPSMMDGALQATIGLITDFNTLPDKLSLPFALDLLRIISPCTGSMFARVHYSPVDGHEDRTVKLDIDLCDESGNICVQMLGFSTRTLENKIVLLGDESSVNRKDVEDVFDDDIADTGFDREFYQKVIEQLLNEEYSVDEAVKLG